MINNFLNVDKNIAESFQRDFIWIAEYNNGLILPEFALENGLVKQNSFFDIDKQNLLRFGYVGHGMDFYFESFNGVIKINGNEYTIKYIDSEDKVYEFTNQNVLYNEIIQFKNSASYFNPLQEGTSIERIEAYNLGYKGSFLINGKEFSFKAIIKIPFNQPVKIEYRIVSKESLKGNIVIAKNQFQKFDYHAELNPDEACELSWVVR